jgi:hypothetical protein
MPKDFKNAAAYSLEIAIWAAYAKGKMRTNFLRGFLFPPEASDEALRVLILKQVKEH